MTLTSRLPGILRWNLLNVERSTFNSLIVIFVLSSNYSTVTCIRFRLLIYITLECKDKPRPRACLVVAGTVRLSVMRAGYVHQSIVTKTTGMELYVARGVTSEAFSDESTSGSKNLPTTSLVNCQSRARQSCPEA